VEPQSTTPYRDKALVYLRSNLGWPIPSAYPLEKFPPIVGWTGINGEHPDQAQVEEWMDRYADSNICLRLAPHVVGIDIDGYDEKKGAVTIAAAEEKHGSLPASYRSTARHDDPISGIRFYRLPQWADERKLKGDLGPRSDIEVIRHSHRYAVVEPSWNPKAQDWYHWYNDIPEDSDLPLLPAQWVLHLSQACECFEQSRYEHKLQIHRYRKRTNSPADTALATKDFENNIIVLAEMPEGSRNNYLNSMAGRTLLFDVFLSGALDETEVVNRLLDAATEAGLDHHEADRTIQSAYDYAVRESEGT